MSRFSPKAHAEIAATGAAVLRDHIHLAAPAAPRPNNEPPLGHLPGNLEAELDAVNNIVSDLWSRGKADFDERCASQCLEVAYCETTAAIYSLKKQVTLAEQHVRQAQALRPTSRGSSAMSHLRTLHQRLKTIEAALGPAPLPEDGSTPGMFVQRRIPADNSCLFHSINDIFYNGSSTAMELRQQCADFMKKQAETKSETLGEDFVVGYADEVLDSTNWGGGVEIDIFSELNQSQIVVFDVENQNEEVFGQHRHTKTRAYLLYLGGNHYDILSWNPGTGSPEQLVFSIRDETCERRARRAASKLSSTSNWRVGGTVRNVAMLRQTSF